jgi:glucan phosphorylase
MNMKFRNFRNITSINIISYIIIQILFLSPAYAFYSDIVSPDNPVLNASTLSPKIMLNSGVLQNFVNLTLEAENNVGFFKVSKDADHELLGTINQLNALFLQHTPEQVIDIVLSNPELEAAVSKIIRAQDRMEETNGLGVDRKWAEDFKYEALKRVVEVLDGRDIFFLQMEYELSQTFLEKFKQKLIDEYLMDDADQRPYEQRLEEATRQAIYATGQLAKLQMAGGLGSFKPDWVGAFYDNLVKFWGKKKAKSRLHVMGVLYAKTIKGEGDLVRDAKLNSIVEKIRKVKDIKNNVQQRIQGESELVKIALEEMDEVATYNIPVNMNGFENVNVTVYSDPYSKLHEYWMYCPEIFHEAYPGNSDDEFRAVQTFVYREVLVRYMEYLKRENKIGNKIIISDSETSTALANPEVMSQDLNLYPVEKRAQYKDIFKQLAEFDIIEHHYNHTIVPAGMGSFPSWKFDNLKIKKELQFIKKGQSVDMRMMVGETHNIISGCSSGHTDIMRENPDLYKHFAHKIREDDLFGNSEGSDVDRWQGEPIKLVIESFMQGLNVKTAEALFRTLETNPKKKREFIQALKQAKKIQKQRFIYELFKGTFGDIDVTREELEADGVDLLNRPFFTFVRRMVPYKCSDFIVDRLENEQDREAIIRSRAVIFIGGRKFDGFSEAQHDRIKELIKLDPRLRSSIIFISNHNVSTSWMMQQGTDFGGMLSWEGMEAGPTSPSNAGLNFTNIFGTPDGVMIERLRNIKRDDKGKIIAGTGYIVEYGEEYANNAMNSRLPDKESFVNQMKTACANYKKGKDYGLVAYNNMWLQMTQGDIKTQAAGTLRIFSKYIKEQKADNASVDTVINSFINKQTQTDIHQILYDGEGDVASFWFGENWPQKQAKAPGLKHFYQALKHNTEQGYIYTKSIDFVQYMREVLKNKAKNKEVLNIFQQINGTRTHYSALTPYEKQKAFLKVLNIMINALENKSKEPEGSISPKKLESNTQVEVAI